MEKKKLFCLGVEGTAHTFGVGIVSEDGKILSNEKSVYKPKIGSGIIPIDAAKHHEEICDDVLEKALKAADLEIDDVDIIAYSAGPGLPPPLVFTSQFADKLAKKYKKPIVPVNHMLAHVEIGKLTVGSKNPVIVYLSGGNTMIIIFTDGRYRVVGETEDLALGNAIDMVAREIKVPYPGGPEIQKLAENGKYVELPYVVKGCDLSYSGIVTAAINLFRKGVKKEDIAYSLQETCFAMLTEVTERAVAHTGKKEVLLVGGVAANTRLQEMMKKMCEEREAKFFFVPQDFASDCGANIAWTGLLAYQSKWKHKFKDKILPRWRIDQVDVTWIK